MKSVDRGQNNQKFEAHFSSNELEIGTTDQAPHGAGPSTATTSPTAEDEPLNVDDMIVDYSTDVFGGLIYTPHNLNMMLLPFI
jgi:hypothetical protein